MNWLFAGGLALAMVTSVSAKERTGKVVRVKGAARYSIGNNVWQPVKVGTAVKSGFLIQTAAGSLVDIILDVSDLTDLTPSRGAAGNPVAGKADAYQPKAEQDVIRVQEDTVLAIDKLSITDTGTDQVTETQLDLRSGKIFGMVKKLTATSRYEIKLPNSVAGVRGTIYTISADGVVQVLAGSVVISWNAPNGTPMTQTVNGGYQFDARTGLLTPIPDYDREEMVKEAREDHNVIKKPRSFIEDHTIYYVSPVQGHNGHGEGGGEGGGP